MSSNNTEPDAGPASALPPSVLAISYLLRHDQLMSALLESMMNGVYTTILLLTLYSLVIAKGWRSVFRPFILVMVLMWAFATIHVGIHWAVVKKAFLDNGQTQDSIFMYLVTEPLSLTMTSGTMFCANTLIADCVLIWRCWVVWNNNWRATVLPSMTLIVGTLFSIFSLVIEADPNTQLSQRSALSQPAVTYTALTLTTTLIATTTIIWRIVTMGYHINRNRYRNIIEIILESAALYSIVLIVYMPFIVLPNVTDAMPQAVVAQMTGIAPLLIVARVSLGQARPDESWTDPPISDLDFRTDTTADVTPGQTNLGRKSKGGAGTHSFLSLRFGHKHTGDSTVTANIRDEEKSFDLDNIRTVEASPV